MQPPFFETRIIDTIALDDIAALIDRDALYASRWQFRQGMSAEEWEKFKSEKGIALFEKMISMCRAQKIIEPRVLYGYFRCARNGNGLIVEGAHRSFRFDFPRERRAPNRCVADVFPEGFVAIQIATVGKGVVEKGAELFAANSYQDAFLLKGFAAEAAEATAAFGHSHIARELGISEGGGVRFSPGYPAFPDLFEQRKIAKLLSIGRIGVALTETCHLIPEYSTSCIISFDPNAAHFRP